MTYPPPPDPYGQPQYGQGNQQQGYGYGYGYDYYGQPYYGQAPYGPPGYPPPTQNDGQATAAMICSIVGAVTCLFPLSIVGIVLGHIGYGKTKRGEAGGQGMALAGIIIGYVTLALVIALVLLGVAVEVWAD